MPDGNGYIIAAYVVTWVAIIGYAVRLHFSCSGRGRSCNRLRRRGSLMTGGRRRAATVVPCHRVDAGL